MKTGICIAGLRANHAKPFLAAIALLAILKSDAAWAATGPWNGLGPEGARVESVAVDPRSPELIYAGTNGMGFVRPGTDGKKLVASNEGLMSNIVLALALDPHAAGTLYAGTGGRGVFKSTDEGKRWALANKGIEMKTIQSLAVDPHHSGTVYAGTWGDGIFKTSNGGQEWQAVGDELRGAFIYALAVDPAKAGHLLAGTSTGAWQSLDDGKSWAKLTSGIPEGVVEAFLFAPGAPAEITMVVNTWVPGKQYVGAILRSGDQGKSWKPLGTGIPETRITALAVAPQNPKVLFAGTETGVFTSTDGGMAWSKFGEELKSPEVGALAITSKAPERLFAGTVGGGVFETMMAR